MSQSDSGLKQFFTVVWRIVNGARKLFLNLLFLLLLFFVVLAMMAPGKQPIRLQSDTTLVVRPWGHVVEEYTSTPLDRALQQFAEQPPPETRLRDLLDAIDQAAGDARITQMLIDVNHLLGIGVPALQEIESAIGGFKDAGKGVVATGDYMSQHAYYLASMADEVWLHPEGMVLIDGYSRIRHYYREGLEKLAVEVNLFRAGDFKSAREPWIRDDMSPEAREANLHWLGSLWQQYLEGVSRHRGIPLEVLEDTVEGLPDGIQAHGGDFAAWAREAGLVDRLASRPEMRQELALRGAPEHNGDGFRGIEFGDYLDLVRPPRPGPQYGDVMVLVAEGDIVSGRPGPGRIGADTLTEQLREIGQQERVQALVLRLNSPGGEVLASEHIRNELQTLRDGGKTVVVSMGELAASGGYWVATAADEIWASPATLTGSIGVFAMIPTFGGTLEKIGVRADGVGTTPMAGTLRVDRPLDPAVRDMLQSSVRNTYREFLERVAEARNMSLEEAEAIAGGRVWSGGQASEHRLVDRLGNTRDAIDAAARMAGLGEEYDVRWYRPQMSPFETFLLDAAGDTASFVARTLGPVTLLDPGRIPLSFVQRLVDDLRYIARGDGRFTLAAHCLCRIQ